MRIGKARARAAQQQQQNAASLASHGSGSNEAGAGEGAGAGLAMVGLRQKPVASSQRMHVDSYDETYFSTHRIFAGVAAIKSAATAAVGLTITSSHSSDRTISVRCPPSGAEGVTAPVVAPVLRVDTALMTALRAAVGDAVEATAGSAVRVEEQRSAGEKLTTEEKSTAQTTSTATDETASTVAAAVASTHSNSSSGVVPVPSSEEARCSPWEGDREDGIEKV